MPRLQPTASCPVVDRAWWAVQDEGKARTEAGDFPHWWQDRGAVSLFDLPYASQLVQPRRAKYG